MRRGIVPALLAVALLLGAGAALAALQLSGKTIEVRLVDIVTATVTTAGQPGATVTAVLTSTAQPTTRPTETQVASHTPGPTQTGAASPTTAATRTATLLTVAVPTGTPAPSLTPVGAGVTQEPQPSASPSGTPPTATPTLAPGTVVEYSIQPGDTLSGIAEQFDTTVEAIVARNNITDPSNILWGFTLQIVVGERTPPTAPPGASPQLGSPTAPTATSSSGPTPSPGP